MSSWNVRTFLMGFMGTKSTPRNPNTLNVNPLGHVWSKSVLQMAMWFTDYKTIVLEAFEINQELTTYVFW
jgi:hypothetical protein